MRLHPFAFYGPINSVCERMHKVQWQNKLMTDSITRPPNNVDRTDKIHASFSAHTFFWPLNSLGENQIENVRFSHSFRLSNHSGMHNKTCASGMPHNLGTKLFLGKIFFAILVSISYPLYCMIIVINSYARHIKLFNAAGCVQFLWKTLANRADEILVTAQSLKTFHRSHQCSSLFICEEFNAG